MKNFGMFFCLILCSIGLYLVKASNTTKQFALGSTLLFVGALLFLIVSKPVKI